MQSTRRSAHAVSLASPRRQSILRQLILAFLTSSPPTALFFAERLYSLDATLEPSVFLIALALSHAGRHNEVIWILRQAVAYPFDGPADQPNTKNNNRARATLSSSRITRPSYEASLRCARLYASCCLTLGREKEGREVLARLLHQSGSPLIAPEPGSEPSLLPFLYGKGESWEIELELARLSKRAGEGDRAIEGYRKVLEANHYCWEALEELCTLGAPPDPDVLFPPRPRPTPTAVSPLVQMHSSRPPPPSLPLPLGPSQSSAVNSAGPIASSSKTRYVSQGAGKGEGLGFFTPTDLSSAATRTKATIAQGWSKMMSHNMSTDVDDISADDSLYNPRAPMPVFHLPVLTATSYGSAASSHSALAQPTNRPSSSTSLFTPPVASSNVAPGVKRARGQQVQAPTSVNGANSALDEDTGARRAVKGVPSLTSARKNATNASGEVRRSTRLSRETLSAGAGSATSLSLFSSSSTSQSRDKAVVGNPREKKRSKSGTGPSVFSDNGSEVFSPRSRTSRSSSPALSSPGATSHHVPVDPALQEAEDYVADVVRSFAIAACSAAHYESRKTIEALMTLPMEQQRSWRCWIGVARAHFEMLNYDKAEKAFAQARQASPHLLESMEMYSTLLWHLRRPTALSFLAQDLSSISSRSTSSWIASGNVFSHLEDHASALKCFKRASQLDENCVYAYTLSGHECIVLEEWERALGFFRAAVKRDSRHYNAWFGLGNVYMQTGKYRMAEYHFRKAADINPTNAMLVCCVGSVLEKLGRRKEALELYERAFLLAPDSPAVRFKRVRVLIALKQYTLAEADLLHLKNAAPNEYNVNFLLGKLYILLNRRSEAVKFFTRAQELEPRNGAALRQQLEMGKEQGGDMEIDGQS